MQPFNQPRRLMNAIEVFQTKLAEGLAATNEPTVLDKLAAFHAEAGDLPMDADEDTLDNRLAKLAGALHERLSTEEPELSVLDRLWG